MPIDHRIDHPAGPGRVHAVLTGEAFLRAYVAALGARLVALSVVPEATTVRMAMPTEGVPALFRPLVGREVPITDHRSWTPDGTGGWRSGIEVRAAVLGRSAVVRGERRLTTTDGGSTSRVTVDVTVHVTLIARQAAAAVRDLATVVLQREAEVLQRFLAPGH